MARRNNVEANVTITFNGEQAKQVVDDLKKKAEQLRAKIAEMQKAANPDTKGISKLQKELNATDKAIKSATTDTKKYEETLKNLNSASIKELTAAQRALLAQIKKLAPGSDEFVAATQKYKQVTARIKSVETAYKQVDESQQSMFRRLASGMNRYFLMASTAIATITGLSMRFRDAARQAAELDDKMAQVMKTTGLSHEQVEQLNEAFKKMDTRTTIEQLNLLAYQAGKLGRNTVESVQQFVESADIINVALGDVLGDNATLEIAKLAEVYSQSTDLIESKDLKGKMMAVGSAINQLGKESTASESYMVDFLGRLGGVATQAGLSADQILGYASALDQMKQKVEMSATAFQKLIQQMIKKPEEFVKAARMPMQDFVDLMNTDMNAAIIRVLEGFNEMGGFTQLVPLFKDMGLDGARAASVIASLAANLDKVSVAQATATDHIEKGTSMLKEYNIMNSSAQAQLEKKRNELHNVVVEFGQSLNPVLLKSTSAITYLIRALVKYGKEIRNAMIAIAALTVVVKAHTIAHGLLNAALKIGNALRATGTVIVNAAKLAYYKLTGATTAATAAQQALNAAMSASVFGIIALAVAGLTVAITRYVKKQREAYELQQQELSLEGQIKKAYTENSAEIISLTDIVNDQNVSYTERNKALKRLKELIPDYHASLTKEGELINNNTEAIDKYLEKLMYETRLQAYKDRLVSIQKEIVDLQIPLKDAEEGFEKLLRSTAEMPPFQSWMKDMDVQELYDTFMSMTPNSDFFGPALKEMMQNWKKQIDEYKSSIKGLGQEYDNIIKMIEDDTNTILTINPNIDNTTFEDALKALEDEQSKIEASIKQDYIDRKISQEEYEEAMTDSNIEFLKKKLDLVHQYGEDETKVLAAYLDAQVAANKLADREIENARKKAEQEAKQAEEQRLRDEQKRLNDLTRLADRFKKELLSPIDEYKEELKKLDEIRNNENTKNLISEEQYQQILLNLKKKYAEKAQRELRDLDELGIFERYQVEKENLANLLDEGLLSWEEYEKEVGDLRIKYAELVMGQISSILNQIGNFISSMRDMELAQAEAQYQADLTNAGDNAEKREKIEEEYEKKKLELNKKYADVDMVINIAKALAAGALAAVEAFAAAGGNPVLGGIFAAIIAATTAMEVGTIIAQRNAIKNASVGSTSSATTTPQGQRVVTGDGYQSGGPTDSASSDSTPVGIVHANEWVAPAWLVRRDPVLFANLEQYRQTRIKPLSMENRGYKDGGTTSAQQTQQTLQFDSNFVNAMIRFSDAVDKLSRDGIQSYMVYDQFKDFMNRKDRFDKSISLK